MTASYNVLFLCTGNSARSILAESLLNYLGRGRFVAYSAGSHPAGAVNPHALALLEKQGLNIASLRSKSWDEFERPDAPQLDLVITVCDNAAGETCPTWPGQPITAHWGIPDPAAVKGSDEEKRKAFLTAYTMLHTRISLMVNLPFHNIERLRLQQNIRDIHRTASNND